MLHHRLRAAAGARDGGGGGPTTVYDWAAYADNAEPAGFSRVWGTQDVWRVRQSVSELDADPTVNSGSGLTIGSYTDVSITSLVRADSQRIAVGGASHNGLIVRASGATRNGYIACLNGASGATPLFELFKYTADTYTQIATVAFSWSVGADYNVRLEAVGTTIRAKIWGALDPEPASWDISVTDSDHASGAVGMAYFWAADYSWGDLTVEDLS